MILRPYGILIAGQVELGVELVVEAGRIEEIRPHTGVPEDYVISPAFVNAHSHLEYRGMLGKLASSDYWSWIREITRLKQAETPEEVRASCHLAAKENRASGVALIGEHSDRPFAGEALSVVGIGGIIFQEVITFFERETRLEKIRQVEAKAEVNRSSGFDGPVTLSPHAYQTVDQVTLEEQGSAGLPLSIHVAETAMESQFTKLGEGEIADFYRSVGVPFETTGKDIVETLADLKLARRGAQWVHCCAVSESDIALMAASCVTVAHCPRSNVRLKCPASPVREMLDAGIAMGLGLDSPASSGPIDMFDEMRSALDVSIGRGRPITAEEVWRMATDWGASSLPIPTQPWEIAFGSSTPLIKIRVRGALQTLDIVEQASASCVEWVNR